MDRFLCAQRTPIFRSISANERPPLSTNPARLPEITRMEVNAGSTGSLLSGGVQSPGRKTMKDYEQQQKSLEEENFQLKLRVYMLEERLQGKDTPDNANEMIVELKVQLATLREELGQKKGLLRRASEALESLEQQYAAEADRQREEFERECQQREERIYELQEALERANQEKASLADRTTEKPYLKAFEPLVVDHAACRTQDELRSLEAKLAELQQALGHMKETVEERDREAALLRRQLDEARAAASRQAQRAEQAERHRAEETAERQRAVQVLTASSQLQNERCRGLQERVQQLTEQLQQRQAERDQLAAEADRLREKVDQVDAQPRLEELQRTCEQLTSGRAADGARIAELELAVESANDRLKVAAANEATLSTALQTVGAQLAERKAELAAARGSERRSAARIQALIAEQRDLQQMVAKYFGGQEAAGAPTAASEPSSPVSGRPAPTPHEVQVYLLRTETQRKDKKIRSMVAEMKEMSDTLMKYRWEVKEVAEEENERLWTELEENKKLIKELQDEKMELVLEKERQIQRLLTQLKEREPAAGSGAASPPAPEQRDSQRELQQARDELVRLRAEAARGAVSLQEAQTEVQCMRSQLAHATLLVGDRDSEIGRLRERLLQQRRLLDEPLPAPQLRQRLSEQLGALCAELAAPRPAGPPLAAELGGAGEMAAESSESAARSEASELGAEKAALLRGQVADLRDQLVARDRLLDELRRRADAADRLRPQLEARERELAAAGQQLAELADLPERLTAAERRLAETAAPLEELAELRRTLEARERELTLAEGQLNEIAELRTQLEERDRQLEAAAGRRLELQQVRQLLAERDDEKAALLRHMDEQRREHEREARALRDKFDLTITAPTWQQYREAEQRHGREQAHLRRRLAETHSACELLQRRLEELADFMEMLLSLEERGVLDLSCLTAQHMADLQRSLLQSRELSQSLTQSLLLGADADSALEASSTSLDALAAAPAAEQTSLPEPAASGAQDQSSLHVPPASGAQDQSSLHIPAARETPHHSSLHVPAETKARKQRSSRTLEPRSRKQSASRTLDSTKAHKRVSSRAAAAADADQSSSPPPTASDRAAEPPSLSEAPAALDSDRSSAAEPGPAPAAPTVAESAVQAGSPPPATADRAAQVGEPAAPSAEQPPAEPDERAARLEQLSAQLESRNGQLLQQAELIDALRRQLSRLRVGRPETEDSERLEGEETERLEGDETERPEGDETDRLDGEETERPAGAPPPEADDDAADGSPPQSARRDPLPGDVRDRFRRLVRRQRTSDRASGTETASAGRNVERALSPILSLARAQSAELLELRPAGRPPKPSRSAGEARSRSATVAEPSDESETAAEPYRSPRPARQRHRSQEAAQDAPPPPPLPGDFSESEAWSEPDRDVSLARIGLDQSSLGTRTESWLAGQSDSDARRSRRRQRAGPQEAQELEAHIESLHQVKDALRAEVDIYQKVLPASGEKARLPEDRPAQTGIMVPVEVLTEIHNLQQQLERAIAANERIRRQLELTPRRAAPPNDELALALKITQEQLAEANDKLSAAQERCDELRSKLTRAKENLRLAQLNAEEFKDKFVRVSDDMVRLRERFNQMEAERERASEDSWRRRQEYESATVRRLERQLEQANTALQEQEQLVRQLREQLLQGPPSPADADKENTPELRASCSESQLLALNREKLRLLSERKQVASRGRLLRSESCLLDGETRHTAAEGRRLEAQRRLEAAKWAGWETERERLLQQLGRLREERGRLRRQLVTSGAEAGRAARLRLQAEAEQARAAEARLAEEHRHCERRLAELGRAMQADKRRLAEVSAQLEEVNAEMEAMRLKFNELDDAGQSCPESTRSCDLPAATNVATDGTAKRSNSESDGHDVQHESDRTSAYSSPDLGIESDCNRYSSRSPHTGRLADEEPESAASENELLRQERDQMHSKLATTRAALQEALDKLSRADQRKARVERAIYRQLSKTHDILRRAKNNLTPAAPAAAELAPAEQ